MILALDFDGTTHPDRCEVDQYFRRLELLEPWLRRFPGVEVVISSSWREAHPLDELRAFFTEDIQSRVVGVTPVASKSDWAKVDDELLPIRFEREAEIKAWLRERGYALRPWVALDDQAWRFGPFCEQLVLCDPQTGLTERELGRAARVLGLEAPSIDREYPEPHSP